MSSSRIAIVVGALIAAPAFSQTLINSGTWSIGDGGNGRTYQVFLSATPISWTAARTYAQSLVPGVSDLATPCTGGENDFIFGVCSGFPTVWVPTSSGTGAVGPWLGATLSGGVWSWVSGEPFCYTNWGLGEPNDGCMSGPTENHIHFSGPAGYPLGSIINYWNDLPDAGCVSAGMFPQSFVVEFTTFDASITQTPAGFTMAVTGGLPFAQYLIAFTAGPVGSGDPCLDGWFYGINPTLFGLLGIVTGGFPFYGTLGATGGLALFFPTPGIGVIQLDHVGVLLSPSPGSAILGVGKPRSLITF